MNTLRLKTAYWLSALIVLLTVVASAGGLAFRELYRDNAFVKTTWLGNDAITLFLAVPLLVVALVWSRRGSVRALLVWFGVLDYLLYNYAFYLFGAAFNDFFLVYVALLGLCIFALIFGLANLDVNEMAQHIRERMPRRWIGGYFLFVAVGLSFVYLSQSIGFIFTGQVPSIVTTSGHPTNVVFALDLTLLVPWLVLGALWLMKRQPWGMVIVGSLSVKGPLYTLVLSVNTVLVSQAGLGAGGELPLWATLTVLGAVASVLFYANVRERLA